MKVAFFLPLQSRKKLANQKKRGLKGYLFVPWCPSSHTSIKAKHQGLAGRPIVEDYVVGGACESESEHGSKGKPYNVVGTYYKILVGWLVFILGKLFCFTLVNIGWLERGMVGPMF